MSERKMKARSKTFWSLSLANMVELATDLIQQYPHLSFDSIEVTTYTEYGDTDVCFEYETPETDFELKCRLEDEKSQRDYRRRQYEQMKKEFEDA